MSPYFSYRPSRQCLHPVVVSVPHAGLAIPECRHELMTLSESVFYRDVDFAIDQMWDHPCEELDITFLKSEVHRYAIDLNRSKDQRNLIWTRSTRQEVIVDSPETLPYPSREILDELIREIWNPYYETIERELHRVRERFGFAIFIDGHSMPSRGTSFHNDPGGIRADIVPGNNVGKTCHEELLLQAVKTAQAAGFTVTPNEPYKGGYLTQFFGRPDQGIHALQIEVNRSVYLVDEESEQKHIKETGLFQLKNWAKTLLSSLPQLPLSGHPPA